MVTGRRQHGSVAAFPHSSSWHRASDAGLPVDGGASTTRGEAAPGGSPLGDVERSGRAPRRAEARRGGGERGDQ
jgi:hypothetical protein